MTAEDAISTEGKHGAGLYGAPPPSHKTKCPQSNNPFGHHPDCKCGWAARERPSQVIPYAEPDLEADLPVSEHEHWWPAENDYEGDQMREERAFND
ncbi:hypothetical protein ACF07D_04830 [Leucobacter sp. NPDC015123]|uniref:hypothetical protein n=1 Tax=Leucobacter sp. NPDC015123 TaxID=3364129 RepID=UPI0036F4AEE0